MDAAARDAIKSKVLADLEQTPFAASSLQELSGGTSNFIYRARLKSPLADGTKDVLIKHSEDYVANSPAFKLTLFRCRIEEECLRALTEFPIEGKAALSGDINFTVRTPKFYHFDEENNTQIQEILHNGKDLKTYALSTYPPNTPEAMRPQCVQLGRALGTWLRNLHDWSATQADLRKIVAENKDIQRLKHLINFSWLLDRVEQFPSILGEAKEIFEKVKNAAAKDLEDERRLRIIHGDFWTGNVLLPDRPLQDGDSVTMFVIDWEMSQIGLPALDLGQMIAELYEMKLYKNVTAGLWIIEGVVDGYEPLWSEGLALRTAIQVGVHLLSFGTSVQGWGTPEQVEMVARTGRDLIVNAWYGDRSWVEEGDLACLFKHAEDV
ncbi:kinase-like domain-containing protein [Nemania sp. NC0429]|nr:kinase-like domain-containing protein [Nemania sp. NC0429]